MGIEEGSLRGDSLAFCPAMWSWGQSAGMNTMRQRPERRVEVIQVKRGKETGKDISALAA